MDNSKETTPGNFALNYGIILGAILVLISIIMYVTGMDLAQETWPMYIYYLIFPIVILIAINAYKKANLGALTLSQALKVGVATAVISGVIFFLYTLIFHYVIEPTYAEQMIQVQEEALLESGMTESQVEASREWMEFASSPLIGGAIWLAFSAFFGLIYSLIGGLIMKNETNRPVA